MKVYIKPWCPWCVKALAWLQQRGITHKAVDVLQDATAYAHMRKISGQSLTPTLEMDDGAVLADFDTRELEHFLRSRGELPA